MAKSLFTIEEIGKIISGKGLSLLKNKEDKSSDVNNNESLKMAFGGSILPTETMQDYNLQFEKHMLPTQEKLAIAQGVVTAVGETAVGIGNAFEDAKKNREKKKSAEGEEEENNELAMLTTNEDAFEGFAAFGKERSRQRILAALGIEEEAEPMEVEGGEVVEDEQGNSMVVEGPSHEDGGVDMNIDEAMNIYSDRIESITGSVNKTSKSIAEEKEKRDKKADALRRKLEKNPNDRLVANALALTLQQNAIADQIDLMWQGFARGTLEDAAGSKEQLMTQMFAEPEEQQEVPQEDVIEEEAVQEEVPEDVPEEEAVQEEPQEEEQYALGKERFAYRKDKTKNFSEIATSFLNNGNNFLYNLGALINGVGGLRTTLQQRSEDVLHENKYKGLAKSVDKLYDTNAQNIVNVTNKRLQDMLNQTQTQRSNIANNFQSISNVAAYNAMLDDTLNQELAKLRTGELEGLTAQQVERSKVLSQNMQKEMEGALLAETMNDADRDAFYNALNLDLKNLGSQVMGIATRRDDAKDKYKDKTNFQTLLDELKEIKNNKGVIPDGNQEVIPV